MLYFTPNINKVRFSIPVHSVKGPWPCYNTKVFLYLFFRLAYFQKSWSKSESHQENCAFLTKRLHTQKNPQNNQLSNMRSLIIAKADDYNVSCWSFWSKLLQQRHRHQNDQPLTSEICSVIWYESWYYLIFGKVFSWLKRFFVDHLTLKIKHLRGNLRLGLPDA